MKLLKVCLEYRTTEFGRRRSPQGALTLPIRAMDADGSVLAEGAASVDNPAWLELPETTALAFVRLTWPSGRTETHRVDLTNQKQGDLTFSDSQIAPNEWSAWAVPRLSARTPLAKAPGNIEAAMERFESTWLRLWKFEGESWQQAELKPEATYRNRAAWQLDLSLSPSAWLLQVGGSNVVWRFVSLPGGGPARVLITPTDSHDVRTGELKIVVTGFRADAETLLEFLSRDAMRSANALASSTALAQQLFADKFDDPVSAIAGAYYLLRVAAWDRLPTIWFENLSQHFAWLPDAAVVHCIRLLRAGLSTPQLRVRARELLVQSLQRGWPLYEEGIALLHEAATSFGYDIVSDHRKLFERAQSLWAAKAWAGAAASFFGRNPNEPSSLKWVGMPRAPRRRHLHPELMKHRPAAQIAAPSSLEKFPSLRGYSRDEQPARQKNARFADKELFLLGDIS